MAIDSLPRAGTPTSVYKFYDERGVHVGESGSRLRHFLTDVEDQPIARCLALSAGTRIMSSVSGRRVGTVSSVSFDGLYVRFVAFLSVDLPASATAYAELRFAQLKHPVSIEVRKIAISDRAVTR